MRIVFIGILFLVAIWVGWGAPIPGVRVTEMQPDPSLPTFRPVTEGEAGFGRPERPRLPEDPTIRRLSERVVNAAYRLEAFPCDAGARRELRISVAALTKEQIRRVRTGEADKAEKSGRRVRSSTDDDIDMIIHDGIYQGVLQPADIGVPRAFAKGQFSPMGGLDKEGRFVCEHEVRG